MRQTLLSGLQQLGLPDARADTLLRYADMLLEKNQVMNLTAITAPKDVATLHLLDCAALLTLHDFRAERVVDVGTGAGFPGMVLQIMETSARLTLLDSLGKRVDWLQEVCRALSLDGADCVHARAEEFAAGHRELYDAATSRAVAQLRMLCELALPLVKVGGVFLAMKAVDCDGELADAAGAITRLGGAVESVKDYPLPCCDVTHRLITIRKVSPTPPPYPRPWAKIKSRPL